MLHELQRSLISAIVAGDNTPVCIARDYGAYDAGVALDIYRNNYRGNLHDALAGAYPVIKRLVGDDFFRYMARDFIAHHPSVSGNLHHYGEQLGDFLQGYPAATSLPYLPDIARLEWAVHRSYFAPDSSILSLSRLASVTPEQFAALHFQLATSSHLLASTYPIVAIWQAHQQAEVHALDSVTSQVLSYAWVTRYADVVQVIELAADQAVWLQALQNGALLGEAVSQVMDAYPKFDLSAALQLLMQYEVLVDFNLEK